MHFFAVHNNFASGSGGKRHNRRLERGKLGVLAGLNEVEALGVLGMCS
jgi:hypothetical protein